MKAYRDENGLPRVGIPRKSPLNWSNLTRGERAEYMRYQMTSSVGMGAAYLPDDVHECRVCSSPALGAWCNDCVSRFAELRKKLEGK